MVCTMEKGKQSSLEVMSTKACLLRALCMGKAATNGQMEWCMR